MEKWQEDEIRHNFETFASAGGREIGDVISLKVRHSLNSEVEWAGRYLSDLDYDELAKVLKFPKRIREPYWGSGGRPIGNGTLVIEHETGPEILFFISHVATVVDPYVTLTAAVGTVVGMGKWLLAKLHAGGNLPRTHAGFRDDTCVRFERRRVSRDGTVEVTLLTASTIDGDLELSATTAELLEKLMDRA